MVNNVTEIAPNTLTPMHVITVMYLIGFSNCVCPSVQWSIQWLWTPKSGRCWNEPLCRRETSAQHPHTKEVACCYRVATVWR